MLNPDASDPLRAPSMPLLAAADLQDNLMSAVHDLDRLQGLLADACDALMQSFHGATAQLTPRSDGPASVAPPAPDGVMQHLSDAITALQFQDMASQLIAHTRQRLRNCADRLAIETMGDEDDEPAWVEDAPRRPNPVTQDEMDAGSVELF